VRDVYLQARESKVHDGEPAPRAKGSDKEQKETKPDTKPPSADAGNANEAAPSTGEAIMAPPAAETNASL
jgi:hypothetical protein